MKEYCVDLEIAKKLEKNGFPQKGEFFWNDRGKLISSKNINTNGNFVNSGKYELTRVTGKWLDRFSDSCLNRFFAPITDELIKQLPREIKDLNFKYYYHLKIEQSPIHDEMYFISYGITNQDRVWMQQYHTNDQKLSNALAKMWLELKKEGYIHEVQRQ